MLAIGGAAGGFFVTFGHYFATHPTTLWGRRFNRAATVCGLLAAVAFASERPSSASTARSGRTIADKTIPKAHPLLEAELHTGRRVAMSGVALCTLDYPGYAIAPMVWVVRWRYTWSRGMRLAPPRYRWIHHPRALSHRMPSRTVTSHGRSEPCGVGCTRHGGMVGGVPRSVTEALGTHGQVPRTSVFAFSASAVRRGNRMLTVVPSPSALETAISPPWSATISRVT